MPLSFRCLLSPVNFFMACHVIIIFIFCYHHLVQSYHVISYHVMYVIIISYPVSGNSFPHVITCYHYLISCYHQFISSYHAISLSFHFLLSNVHFLMTCHINIISLPGITSSIIHVITCYYYIPVITNSFSHVTSYHVIVIIYPIITN